MGLLRAETIDFEKDCFFGLCFGLFEGDPYISSGKTRFGVVWFWFFGV